MARVATTGISAFIGAGGELMQTGKQFEPELLTANVVPYRGLTPYAKVGNWLIIGLCLAILGICWIRDRASL
jgi:apolipoprotein N-acyltransferase